MILSCQLFILLRTAIFSALLVVYTTSTAQPDNSYDVAEEEAETAITEAKTMCGLHCLYVMLRLHGVDIEHEDFQATVPVGSKGSSLHELQQASISQGMHTKVYKCQLDDLDQWRYYGVIALIQRNRLPDLGPHPTSVATKVGHFVTLVGYDEEAEHILAIDGSFGSMLKITKEKFLEEWTGYVLGPALSEPRASSYWVILCNLGVWLGVLVWIFYGSVRKST